MIEARVSVVITAYNSETYLQARSWSNSKYRRAMHAIDLALPRWRNFWFVLVAFLVYPSEMRREKPGAVVRSVSGDALYRDANQAVRSRQQARGPE